MRAPALQFARRLCIAAVVAVFGVMPSICAQQVTANATQRLTFAGLRSVGAKGQINAIRADSSGNLFMIFDQGDGIRILEVTKDGLSIVKQVHLGSYGDSAAALSLDPAGNVYIAGSSTSGALFATAGAAVPTAASSTTNSYVAKFDSHLNELFLTFTGGTRISASAVVATADAVFVAGVLYGSDLPVTSAAVIQAPAPGSFQNGFIERLSTDGASLVYATYLSGSQGDTTPTSLAADTLDDVWIAGSTTASGLPTINAMVPEIISNPSGFLMRLTPAGDSFIFSTFVPGPGLTSVALDSTGTNLLLSGSIALGQFPVDTVLNPLLPTTYQVLLRMPLDGSSVISGTVIAPGTQSVIVADPQGESWIAGEFAPSMIPTLPQPPLGGLGTAYAVRVSPAGIDQTVRLGGIANQQQTYASIPLNIAATAVDGTGTLILAGSVQPTASSSLLSTETYDLPLNENSSSAFSSAVKDAEASPVTCSGSLCSGSAAYLARIETSAAAPALAFAMDDLPFVSIRNLGSGTVNGLNLSIDSGSLVSDCATSLAPAAECTALFTGGLAGTLSYSFGTSSAGTVSFPAYSAAPPNSTIVVSPKELDFGVEAAASPPSVKSFTLTNLGASSQSFTEGLLKAPKQVSPFSEQSNNCPPGSVQGSYALAAGASCRISVAFSAAAATANSFANGEWAVGSRQVLLTGYEQLASLSVSSTQISFGTQYAGVQSFPRYLYLSNSSAAAVPHAIASLPAGSPFTVSDGCPGTLAAGSVCQLAIHYQSPTSPSSDAVTLQLDQGLSVNITGQTKSPPGGSGSTVSPDVSAIPASATFGDAVAVTGVSSATETIAVINAGSTSVPIALTLAGDFIQTTSCGSTLAAGATCAVALQFAPSEPGLRQGLLTISSGTGSPIDVPLSGQGTAIFTGNNLSPAFGDVPVGQPATLFYKISQAFASMTVSATGPYLVTLVEDSGYGYGAPPPSAFVSTVSGSCHNCWVGIRFAPTAAGSQPGTMTFSSATAGRPFQIPLSGSGLSIAGIFLSATSHDFGSVAVGSVTGSQTFTVTNSSSVASPIALSVTGPFTLLPGARAPCTDSLPASATCEVALRFSPTTSGPNTGTLTLLEDSTSTAIMLTGTATPSDGLSISPLALVFENTSDSTANLQTVTLTNSGSNTLQIGAPLSGTTYFQASSTCANLAPAASCTLHVNFTPGSSQTQDVLSIPVLSIDSSGVSHTSTYSIALTGNYTTQNIGLQIAPASTPFGPSATLSLGQTRLYTLTNASSGSMTITLSTPQNFLLATPPCPVLAPATSCNFAIQFAPLVAGDISGSLQVVGTPMSGAAPITGTAYAEGYGAGSGDLSLTGGLTVGGVHSFGQVETGQNASATFTFTNSNGASQGEITVQQIKTAPPFSSTSDCTSPLPAGATCSVQVTYTPIALPQDSTSSTDVGSLVIESDAASSPTILTLTGQPASPSSGSGLNPVAAYIISQGSLNFPPTSLGNRSTSQTIQLTNAGTTLLHITAVMSTSEFQVQNDCSTLAVAAQCTVQVASTPQTLGQHLSSLTIASDAANSLDYVSLFSIGVPASLVLTPSSLTFSTLKVGGTAAQSVTATNTGASPVVFTSVGTTGPFTSSNDCPQNGSGLPPQASCTIKVTFSPAAAGSASGTLSFTSSATTNPLQVPLVGVGVLPQLAFTPTALNFGNVSLGGSSQQSLAITNISSSPVTSLTATASGDFSVASPCPQITLAPGGSCQLTLAFQPAALGNRTGTLEIASSDPASPATLALVGAGMPAPGFSLTVDGSSSASVTVTSGAFASFSAVVSPTGGYQGGVTLTCTPVQLIQDSTCSISPSQLSITGMSPAYSMITINTLYGGSGVVASQRLFGDSQAPIQLSVAIPVLLSLLHSRKKRQHKHRRPLTAVLLSLSIAGLAACAGLPPGPSYTPPGTYQFNVTATSTEGQFVTQTVVLNLTVTNR